MADPTNCNVLTIAPKIKDVDDFKKLSILMKPRYKSSRSLVWRFFGTLVYRDIGCDPVIISNDSYCNLCFEEERLHCYKFSSSSTNLQRHLATAHNITRSFPQDINAENNKETPVVKQENFNDNFYLDTDGKSDEFDILGSKNISSTIKTKDSEETCSMRSPQVDHQLNVFNNLAIMCCKDLLPFDYIDGEGFRQFLINTEVVNNKLSLPTSFSIQEEVLVNMYSDILKKVNEAFDESPSTISLSIETQNDLSSSDLKYSRFKFHFSKENFEPICISLPVVSSGESNVSDLSQIEQFCDEYNLSQKSIILIEEKNEADKLPENEFESTKLFKHYCLLHSSNDLINTDGLSASEGFQNLLIQINHCVGQDLNSLTDSKKLLKSFKILNEVLSNRNENYSMAGGTNKISGLNCMPWYVLTPIIEYTLHEFFVSQIFKDLDNSTLESSLTSENEKELKDFLSLFQKLLAAFEILNGNLYASCALVLLFRAEIESILMSSDEDDTQLLKDVKGNMLSSLNSKFPITEIHVCAALLDPSQRSLPSIREFLFQKHLTSVEFLSNMDKKYVKADDKSVDKDVKEEMVDINSSVGKNDLNESTVTPWKRIKLEILAKHTNTSSSTALEREIQQYMCLFLPEDVANDDPLAWWKDQKKMFPKLSNLARIILSIPAGCCTIGNLIEDENVCDKIKKLSLPSEDLTKFLFVRENLTLLNGSI